MELIIFFFAILGISVLIVGLILCSQGHAEPSEPKDIVKIRHIDPSLLKGAENELLEPEPLFDVNAEFEQTRVEELVSPWTSEERKEEIASELRAMNYKVTL